MIELSELIVITFYLDCIYTAFTSAILHNKLKYTGLSAVKVADILSSCVFTGFDNMQFEH